ncbi:threonine aldolase family protein [Desertivirga xinjiangensis]|uniref:threonine aldolase family protein n=1 Tax=Desertivirga xinjiangensis TaxID=539206 RepID=UPI00210C4B78|nr:GntG family PLP-dependent aldolase [Pedobacter xinjiangensis]
MIVDFRSDTVTQPTPGMLNAMFEAKTGDDVYHEDETVNALEEKLANMFGMQAGLFCPSGTMTNQIAIKCLTHPLDEVICDLSSHVYQYEGGGIAFNSGASVRTLKGDRGRLTAELIEANINPHNIHHPETRLVVLENTSNRGGGSFYTLDDIEPIYHLCQLKKLSLHLDGARIFNALAETGDHAKNYGHLFDSISVCLSKGLGAPVGSVLLGSIDMIQKARRIRKVLGGGMRQAGYLAAAGIYALDNHIKRLKDDHKHARMIAETLRSSASVQNILPVDTNIVIAELDRHISAESFVDHLADHGIKCAAFGNHMVRFVTHLGIDENMIDYAVTWIKKELH